MEYFPDVPFLMTDTKIKEQVSFESWKKKKETFAYAIFGKIYVASAINCTGKLFWLRACMHERDCARVIDKPGVIMIRVFRKDLSKQLV